MLTEYLLGARHGGSCFILSPYLILSTAHFLDKDIERVSTWLRAPKSVSGGPGIRKQVVRLQRSLDCGFFAEANSILPIILWVLNK